MERPVTYKFKTPTLTIDITGNIPNWCTYRIPYAKAEQISIQEGTVICQFHSHVLYFMEVIEIDLHTDLAASYLVENTSLFLYLMIKGGMSFLTPEGKPIANAPEGVCYATYNKSGEYVLHLPKGKYLICYLCPRPLWILRNLDRYPRLRPFMESMDNSDDLFDHMPACLIDSDMKDNLKQLLEDKETKGVDLESLLSGDAKILIDDYQRLLDVKFAQRAYRIKDFLENNFADASLDNTALARMFNVSEKTMIDDFKDQLGNTPYHYLIQVRMVHAKRMLTMDKMHVKDVYIKVGYRDLHSFQVQYKKSMGNPPSDDDKG
ncbi:AraC family transcriptional regulator [Pedobacter sp. MC2016-24]|uniref:helix-turn-helix domain-containing protein n=1 Tax=Pedobacter sp. MC2016-24 TaxID=2780090 RepID=UPI0018820B07|nr:AraC family transcriptional regulator [Pedobacter sp. MC2016-24]MBE9597855.1 helix-turn-helix transcriptional regulator [Pedobacter sp. MC2016-24]